MLVDHTGLIRIGDTARFPLGRLGDEQVYRYRWAVDAFTRDGCVIVRRLHDGITRTLAAARWFEKYGLEERYVRYSEQEARKDARRQAARQLAERRQAAERSSARRAKLQTDPTQPGFYVSARKGPKYALLLGPFVDHGTALRMVEQVWPIVREYDDPFAEVGVGTCRTETSEREGKFNGRIFGG